MLLFGSPAYGQADGGYVDNRPLTNFVDYVRNQIRSGRLDLSQKFSVDYDFVLDANGRFDSKRSNRVKGDGDAKMSETALAGIRALDESGYLNYLRNLDIDRGRISIVQDGKDFSFVLRAEAKSPQRARTTMSALNAYLSVGKMKVRNTTDRFILDNTRITQDASFVLLDFTIPASQLNELPLGYKPLPLA